MLLLLVMTGDLYVYVCVCGGGGGVIINNKIFNYNN